MVAGALNDDLVAGIGQAVQGAVAQDGIVKQSQIVERGSLSSSDSFVSRAAYPARRISLVRHRLTRLSIS